MKELGEYDSKKVDEFLDEYKKITRKLGASSRIEVLDKRINDASGLTLADKVEVVKRLAPRADFTDFREELRLERLIRSISPAELPLFKFALDYDGDYKDLEEYVFHDIDNEESQERIIAYLSEAGSTNNSGTKILTDVDDTLYANLVDDRYPRKTIYPGVLELYDSIKKEPFEVDWIPLTTLSARPNPIAGTLEEGSIRSLIDHTHGRLRPSALSGKVKSSVLGTIETLARDKRDEARKSKDSLRAILGFAASVFLPDFEALERKIGQVKFNNFRRFAKVYPDYHFVFFGDSGQADALTAELMVSDERHRSKVVSTFIHDLGDSARSPTFSALNPKLVANANAAELPSVFLFRNYIQAAVLAYSRVHLISPEALANVTKVALKEFLWIPFRDRRVRDELKAQYKSDAEDAIKLLEEISGELHEENAATIREQLEKSY